MHAYDFDDDMITALQTLRDEKADEGKKRHGERRGVRRGSPALRNMAVMARYPAQ